MATTLEILTSPALKDVRHGFFTRRGGASSGIFSGLNCGPGSSDQAEAVRTNRTRAADAMGVAPEALLGVKQVHSPDVATVDGVPDRPVQADAIVTATPGLAISVLTADCQPVLFADTKAGVIGAAHAGWRGALDGVLENTLEAMEALGAHREDTVAVIGPCISIHAYEVGEEFLERFIVEDPSYGRFFSGGPNGKPHFDLPSFSLHRLREAGIGEAEWVRRCTYGEPENFYSYRRTTHAGEADYGRLLSAIRL
ncbi:peptidoglycan editing factor PgeF [Thioclava atlantica]|uniref:Purine nucleoside phosphorylase n=1 Tax=Thioclava atlantica TaxID=1317124 RepID=A0A085U149_9RHOB|nr:peptidoglycan editing factor PgeF [Thioclava atlantica]KFE36696.1 multi-copper polyphenol oxidoreductase laccase [Thioclava atlantica]